MGHPQQRIVSSLIKQFHLPCSSNSSSLCFSYILGKHARLSLGSIQHKSIAPFQLIYFDVWGPTPLLSSLGHRYALIFVDDYSCYTWVYLIKNKVMFILSFFNLINSFIVNLIRKIWHSIRTGEGNTEN